MGCIIDSCEYKDSFYLETSICYSAKAIFVMNILLFGRVIHQIFHYRKKKDNNFTRKLCLFYLLLVEITSNMLYSGIRAFSQLYLIDIIQRHFVFIFLIYYFGRKLVKSLESTTHLQRMCPLILSICTSLYFFSLLVYGLIASDQESSEPSCKANYWVYLRVGGFLTIFIFIILGIILINRHKKAYEDNADFTMIIKYSVAGEGNLYNQTEKSLIEKNIENMLVKDEKNYNIWLIMGTHFFSAVLTLTTTLYYAINITSAQDCEFFPFDREITTNMSLVVLIGWCLYVINYFLPILVILKVFNFKEMKFPLKPSSFSEEEDYPYHKNLKIQGHDQFPYHEKSGSVKSSSSSINKNLERFSKNSFESRRDLIESENEEEKKDIIEQTRSSGFL